MSARADARRSVCFAPSAYAGFWRRLAVEIVDTGIVALLFVIAAIGLAIAGVDEPLAMATLLLGGIAPFRDHRLPNRARSAR